MAQRGRHGSYGDAPAGRKEPGDARDAEARRALLAAIPEVPDSRRYARANYGSGASGEHARRARPQGASVPKRVAIGVLVGVLALAVAAAAYLLWFSATLNRELAPSEDLGKLLDEQLVSASLDEPFYMLVLGSDSREGSGTSDKPAEMGDNQRSDVIILARVDAPRKTVTLVSVPRDTPYRLDDGSVVKINEVYNIGGAAYSVKAVSELTGVDIAHYVEVRVSELESIVDAVGGVEVYVDRDMTVKDTLTGEQSSISEGLQTLNGAQAQVFARNRHAYSDTGEGEEFHRQGNVRTLMKAIVEKALDRPVVEIPGTVLELARFVTTDLKTGDILNMAMMFAGGDITMYSCTGPSKGAFMEQYNGAWLCYPNPEGWAELMRQVDSGAEPGDIDYEATQLAA